MPTLTKSLPRGSFEMIAWLRGILMEKDTDSVILDVGGVGYRLFVTNQTLARLPAKGSTAELLAHTVMREDAIQLYGFVETEEKQAFVSLLGVNGIGPKLARVILSGISPEDLAEAVVQGNSQKLQSIPGVGKRMAQRIIIELKGKVGGVQSVVHPSWDGQDHFVEADGLFPDVVSVLINLGYRPTEARRAVAQAREVLRGVPTVQGWVREALKLLSP